jgi:hypothetical protein
MHKRDDIAVWKIQHDEHGWRYVAYERSQPMVSKLTGQVSSQRLFTLYVYCRPEWFRDRIMELTEDDMVWPWEIEEMIKEGILSEVNYLDKETYVQQEALIG